MATIYDDVETLKQQMTAVQAAVSNAQSDISNLTAEIQSMAPVPLENGNDLDDLIEGIYYVPTLSIAATLSNLPTDEHTGFIEVFKGGSSGQIVQRFTPFRKDYINVYQRGFYNGSWGVWKFADLTDSGWKTLPLASGIIPYSADATPKYRKIGDVVYLMGAVKGVNSSKVIGTLPEGYRPEIMNFVFVQNMSIVNGNAQFARWVVKTTGEIIPEKTSAGFDSSYWFPLNTNFAI